MQINNQDALKKSIVLIGPIGVGKSLISRQLQEKTKLPIISMDTMRHCEKNIDLLVQEKRETISRIDFLKNKLSNTKSIKETNDLNKELNKAQNALFRLNNSIEGRSLLPNLPNYQEMGYDYDKSEKLKQQYGIEAWHFYNKKFEIQLLEAVVAQLSTPCIIDCGGGMPVTNTNTYRKLKIENSFLNVCYNKENLFDIDTKGLKFSRIKEIFENFDKVIYLELPKDYKISMQKAKNNSLNDMLLKNNQYEKLCTQKINVDGLIDFDKPNFEVANAITDTIMSDINISKKEKSIEF